MTGEIVQPGKKLEVGADPTKIEFSHACQLLWDRDVRTELIYNRGLSMCRGCLGFFLEADKCSTHPAHQTFSVMKLFKENNVTTACTFFKWLWTEAMNLVQCQGRVVLPRMSTVHIEPTPSDVAIPDTSRWYQTRIHLLEQELATSLDEKKSLQAHISHLENEVKELMERMMSEAAGLERIKRQATKHIDRLHDLLHLDGCRCTGGCEEEDCQSK